MAKVAVPTSFTGRKALELQAFKIARREFERQGWQLVPLGLDRETILPLDNLFRLPVLPPQLVLLIALPDAVAIYELTETAFLVEVKSTNRETVAIRCRDLLALQSWVAVICIVHLPTERVFACFANELSSPERIIVPREPDSIWDAVGLKVIAERYPDAAILDIEVAAGSKAPFGLWSLNQFQPLTEFLLRGDL